MSASNISNCMKVLSSRGFKILWAFDMKDKY